MRTILALVAILPLVPALWSQQPAGDVEAAIRTYREYLTAHPDSLEARSNLGAALARSGRYAEAIAEYDTALAKSPDNPVLLLNLGLAYYKSGRPAEAATRFERAVSLAPQFKDQVTLLLASCYNALARYKDAIALLAPLESEKSADLGFDYLYGTALIGDGRNAAGAAVVDRVLGQGESAEALLLRGTLRLKAHEHEGALADLQKAISLNGRLPGAHARLGELLLAMRETERARAAFEQELAVDPDEFTSNLNLGVLAKQDQDYAPARGYFASALKARPNDPGVRYQLALLDVATGNRDEARKALEALIAESPDFAEAHATLAAVYYRLDRRAEGDRERALAQKLIDRQDAAQTGAVPR
jgi:Flp pilus assembly protein TadD